MVTRLRRDGSFVSIHQSAQKDRSGAKQLYRDFAALALWGVPLAASAWVVGPWWMRNVPLYWWVFGGSLLTWAVVRSTAPRPKREAVAVPFPAPVSRAA